MADLTTKKYLGLYRAAAPLVTMFLSSLFKSPLQNFHNSEKVEFDIVRSDEDVAIVITDLSTGANINSDDLFSSKEVTPPIFDEEGTFNSFELLKRQPGQNPYDDPDFQASANLKAFRIFRKLEAKIRRAIELMASQVLQTGILTLNDKAGNPRFTINFGPKATHFPTAAIAWDDTGADPRKDMANLADVIRADAHINVDMAILGSAALSWFQQNDAMRDDLNNRRIFTGEINPRMLESGATYIGWTWVGTYRIDLYTYASTYKHPVTGVVTPYISPNSVVMMSSTSTDLDLTFGAIPRIVPPESRVLKYLPPRLQDSAGGMDLSTFAYVTPDGKSLKVTAGTRPLTIPTGIDSFGCLDADTDLS